MEKRNWPTWSRALLCTAIALLLCTPAQDASEASEQADPIQALDKALEKTDAIIATPQGQTDNKGPSQVKRAYFGMTVQEIPAGQEGPQSSPDMATLLITRVAPGSPAEQSGLKPDDRITEINGRRFDDIKSMMLELMASVPEKEMRLTITRNGNTMDAAITPLTKNRD